MIPNPYPGKFIAFEGIDYSGKSEQYKLIREFLLSTPNLNVIFTKEPPNNVVGVEIYDILRGHHPTITLEDLSELEMQRKYFLSRRMQYQDLNLPALRAGVHVISDRSLVSVVYGLSNMNELDHFLGVQAAMFDFNNTPCVLPDLVLIYDVDVDTAMTRSEKKTRERDKFEERSRLERSRNNYLAVTSRIPGCVVIDGRPSIDEVFKETKKHVFELLGLKL